MHWDGTVTLGNLLTIASIAVTLFVGYNKIYTRVIRFMDKIEFLLAEYPPHKHAGDTVIYPELLKRRSQV